MTNKEWLLSLPDVEYYKQMASYAFRCITCVFWKDGKCLASGSDTCMKGHVLWLKEEHHD